MTTTQVRDLKGLRVEEGKTGKIPWTEDPLDGTWTRPDPALKKLLFMQECGILIVFMVFTVPMLLIITLAIDSSLWLATMLMLSPILILILIVAALTGWTANRMYERHRFRITDEELIIETGFISTTKTMIPLVQVQQVNVYETWMSKRYGLKNIIVNTAGFTYVPNAMVGSNGFLMGLRNADEVAYSLLSRVKHAKSRAE